MGTYGISHTDIMDSVWHVVEAVNIYPQFRITYPSSVGEQEKIVAGFERASSVGFNVCAGAVDGILICRGCTQEFPATKSKKLVKVPRTQ